MPDEEPDDRHRGMAIAVAFPVIAAAVMVGGVFIGFAAASTPASAGLLGVALAVAASRFRRRCSPTC